MSLVRIFMMLSLLSIHSAAMALSIKNVSHSHSSFNPNNERVAISFELDEPAQINLSIYDAREILIRKFGEDKFFAVGQHSITWDGRDHLDRIVPAEAYHYTIVAKNRGGGTVEHDLTDITIGKAKHLKDISWDSNKGIVEFELKAPSRIRLRAGMKNNGPMFNTLLNWEVMDSGDHQIRWDGMDRSGVIKLGLHKELLLSARAFTLSSNTIIVKDVNNNGFIKNISWEGDKRAPKKKIKRRMFDQHLLDITELGDFDISLKLVGRSDSKSKTISLSDKVALKLDISDKERQRVISQRFELVFYLDGQFLGESESGVLPTTWNWDPKGINPGIHYITANVRGYEGNFGTATLKFNYQPGL